MGGSPPQPVGSRRRAARAALAAAAADVHRDVQPPARARPLCAARDADPSRSHDRERARPVTREQPTQAVKEYFSREADRFDAIYEGTNRTPLQAAVDALFRT